MFNDTIFSRGQNNSDITINIDNPSVLELVNDPNTSSDMLRKMWDAGKDNSSIFDALEENPETPEDVIEQIWYHYKTIDVKTKAFRNLMKHKNTPIIRINDFCKCRKSLLEDLKFDIEEYIATYPKLPTVIIENIYAGCTDVNSNTCRAIASNPSTPSEIIKELWNKKISFSFFRKNPDASIRKANFIALLTNSNVPADIIQKMWEQKDKFVEENGKVNSKIIALFAKHPNVSANVLTEIWNDGKDINLFVACKLIINRPPAE
jgi:hypothetical protein